MVAYEAKFHVFSCHALQLITSEEQRIWYFVKDLNSRIQMVVLSVDASYKSFQEAVEFAKKEKVINKQRKVKVEENKVRTSSQFNNTSLKGHGS